MAGIVLVALRSAVDVLTSIPVAAFWRPTVLRLRKRIARGAGGSAVLMRFGRRDGASSCPRRMPSRGWREGGHRRRSQRAGAGLVNASATPDFPRRGAGSAGRSTSSSGRRTSRRTPADAVTRVPLPATLFGGLAVRFGVVGLEGRKIDAAMHSLCGRHDPLRPALLEAFDAADQAT